MTILSFLIAVIVLVAIHEWGHYIVARWCGVKVIRFSVGFGRVIYSKKWNEDQTEFALSWIPLGGYVKMLDTREAPVEDYELHRAFDQQSVWKRLAVVFAGPLINLIFAVVVYAVIFGQGVTTIKAVINEPVVESMADKAGFEALDEIVAVNGQSTKSWQQAQLALTEAILNQKTAEVNVLTAEGVLTTRTLPFETFDFLNEVDLRDLVGLSRVQPVLEPILGQIAEDGPAFKAGLKTGDRVQSMNGEVVEDWMSLVRVVQKNPNQLVELEVIRDGALMVQQLRLGQKQFKDESIGYFGAGVLVPEGWDEPYRVSLEYGLLGAIGAGFDKTVDMITLTLIGLKRLVTGGMSIEQLSGPVTIAQYAGTSASFGFIAFLSFLAFLSVSLGVLNLLPIPMLDGGHILFYLIEIVKGSPVSLDAQFTAQKVGLVLLVSLTFIALYNDLLRLNL